MVLNFIDLEDQEMGCPLESFIMNDDTIALRGIVTLNSAMKEADIM